MAAPQLHAPSLSGLKGSTEFWRSSQPEPVCSQRHLALQCPGLTPVLVPSMASCPSAWNVFSLLNSSGSASLSPKSVPLESIFRAPHFLPLSTASGVFCDGT